MKYIDEDKDMYTIIKHCLEKINEQGSLKKHMELEFRLGFFNDSGFIWICRIMLIK